jgi:divalent metal cation (Fe/Co/Zn/Cd) transporter
VQYHGVRFRTTGNRLLVEVHLLFPHETPVGEAHSVATQVEERLPEGLDIPTEVVTHLESLEDHGSVHRAEHYTGRPL